MNRFNKLVKRYTKEYGLTQDKAETLAKAVINRRNVFAVQASLGIKHPPKQ